MTLEIEARKTMTTAIIYMRASTNEQKQVHSIAIQKSVIQDYCDRNGFKIIEFVFEYQSGRVDRPVFNAALERCVREGHLLVSSSPDRCSRSMSLFSKLGDKELSALRFVSTGATVVNLTVLAVLIAQAHAEAISTSCRVRASYKYLKSINPDHNWGRHAHHDRVAAIGRSVNQERAQAHNTRIRTLVTGFQSQGLAMREIADILADLGVSTRRGKRYTAVNLYRVMKATA